MALVTLSTSDVFKDGTGTPIANGVLVLALLGPQNPEVLFTGLHAQRIASFTLNASGQLTGTPQIYGSDQLDSNEIYFWEVFRDSTLLAPVAAVGPLTGQLLNTTDSQPVSLLNHPAAGGSPVITAQGFPAGNPTTQVLPLPPTVLQPKNTVLAGPTSGANAAATFRPLIITDLPSSVSLEPKSSDAVLFVSTNGNDANDGLSWGTAKGTISGALSVLPTTSFGVLSAAPYGTIHVGAGTYTISSTMVINSPLVHIIGVDKTKTIISSSANPCFQQTLSGTTGGTHDPFLSNITLSGNGSANQVGISAIDSDCLSLQYVEFNGFSGAGAIAVNLTNNTNETERLLFLGTYFNQCTTGISLVGAAGHISFGHNEFISLQFNITAGQTAISLSGGASLYKSVVLGVVNTNGAGTYTVVAMDGAGTNVDGTTLWHLQSDNSGGGTLTGVVFNTGSPVFHPAGAMNGLSVGSSGTGTFESSLPFIDGALINAYPAATGLKSPVLYGTGSGTVAAQLSPGVGFNAYNIVVNNPGSSRNLSISDPGENASFPFVIASGTATMTAGAITAASCQAAITVAAPGVLATDSIEWAYATAPTLTTDALLNVSPYVTSGNVNFTRCNPTASSITGTAIVINWRVIR